MQILVKWIKSVILDTRSFILLEHILKLLQVLPFCLETLKLSGVATAVKSVLEDHPLRDIRKLAEGVVVHWLREGEGEEVEVEEGGGAAAAPVRPVVPKVPVQLKEEDERLLREKEAAIAQVWCCGVLYCVFVFVYGVSYDGCTVCNNTWSQCCTPSHSHTFTCTHIYKNTNINTYPHTLTHTPHAHPHTLTRTPKQNTG